jgi:hypothetical protein
MSHPRRGGLAAAVAVVVAIVAWQASRRSEDVRPVPAPPPRQMAASQTQPDNHRLVDDFIRWYEREYIRGMRTVGGSATDVEDLVREIGLEEAVERYAALRRVNLDYAVKHPGTKDIPDGDLERIGQAQYEHVLANARTSLKWIDYKAPKVKRGIVESYRQGALVWIPFYQKLLAAPASSEGADFKARIRVVVSRDEYARMVDQTAPATVLFHAALKEGVSWYAALWVRGMIDKACRQDIAVCRATVDEIYGTSGK